MSTRLNNLMVAVIIMATWLIASRMWTTRKRKMRQMSYLISVGVTANGDGLGPTWHKPGNFLADDWLAEHCATQDVTDRAIGAQPHLLQLELCPPT